MASYTDVHPKVAMAGVGGSLATIVLWGIQAFAHVAVPAEVGGAIATLFAFLAGYLTTSAPAPPTP